jgi:hypothetical protein
MMWTGLRMQPAARLQWRQLPGAVQLLMQRLLQARAQLGQLQQQLLQLLQLQPLQRSMTL